ncbi:MAG: hypothetical protein FWB90_08720 [Fibromonadales bacterium]|nr:hypothetical protein [Fibromonadales bacterium]
MKRLLLLFALECHALTLPLFSNPAIWNAEEMHEVEKTRAIAFRYSEPFEDFHVGKTDIVWSDGRFLAAAGFGGAALDSIYRELEFSGVIGFRPFNFLSFKLGETANISWVPGDGSWQEHRVSAGASFFYKDWAKVYFSPRVHLISKTPVSFSWLLGCEANFSSLYSFGVQLPLHIYQQVKLGYFSIYNSFAYPGPVLGFGFALGVSGVSVGVGYLRAGYPGGNLGYVGVF